MSILACIKRFLCPTSYKKSRSEQTGVIKFFDRKKRFGFIVSGKNEYFFHAAATASSAFKSLKEGVTVKFVIVPGKKGPQADHVMIVY